MLNIELPYDPAIPLLGIYPEKMKTLIQKDICTPVFIAALFTIVKTWKQPKGPSIGDWFKKMWLVFPSGAVVRSPPANAGDTGLSPGPGRSHMPGAAKPACHNYWACAPQLLKPECLEPMLHSKRSHRNEKPTRRNWRKPAHSNEDPTQPKIK